MAKAVLAGIGVTDVKLIERPYEAMFAGLAAGQLDMACGVGIRKDQCSQIAFSNPDHVAHTAFVVPAGNPKGIKTFAEAAATKVAVVAGSPQEDYARAAGVKPVLIPNPDGIVQAVIAEEVDCGAFIDISLRLVAKGKSGIEVTAGFTPDGQQPLAGVFAFAKDKASMLPEFNRELASLHESGRWLTIAEPFGFTKDNIPPKDLTAEKLCAG